jgi:hypothetical protein
MVRSVGDAGCQPKNLFKKYRRSEMTRSLGAPTTTPHDVEITYLFGSDEVNVSQFASQFVSRILVDGAPESVTLRMTATGGSSRPIRPRCAGAARSGTSCGPSSPTTRSAAFRRSPPRRDLPPKLRKHSTVQRDHEYKRLGTVTLSAPSRYRKPLTVVGIIGRGILNKIRVPDFYSAGCRFESYWIAERCAEK